MRDSRRRAVGSPRVAAGALPILLLTASCTFAPPRHDAGLPGVAPTSSDAMRDPFVAMALGTIREELESWGRSLRRERGRSLHDHYATDAFVVQPAAGFVRGDSAILALERALSTRTSDGDLSLLDIEVSDGIAYVFGGYFFQASVAGTSGSAGRHVTILRREGAAGWRIRMQHYRPDPPATPFPGLAESPEPEVIEVGTTVSGQSSRDTFFRAVTLVAAVARSWRENDARALSRLFAPNALLLLPDHEMPARGPAVAVALDSALVRHGALHTIDLDFTASGRLAALSGRYLLESRDAEDRHGFYTMILVRRDSDWLVRALVID